MNRKRVGIAAAMLAFVAIGLAWYFRPPAVDPQVQQFRDTQQKLIELPDGRDSREERRELFGQMREQMQQLKPEQQQELSSSPPPSFMRAIHKRISPYFELAPEERVAFLDREIQRMEEMMRDMRPMMAAASGAAGGNGSDRGPPFGGNMSQERRDEMQRRMLDKTTPIQRAQMAEFLKDIMARRKELGLQSFPAPPF